MLIIWIGYIKKFYLFIFSLWGYISFIFFKLCMCVYICICKVSIHTWYKDTKADTIKTYLSPFIQLPSSPLWRTTCTQFRGNSSKIKSMHLPTYMYTFPPSLSFHSKGNMSYTLFCSLSFHSQRLFQIHHIKVITLATVCIVLHSTNIAYFI